MLSNSKNFLLSNTQKYSNYTPTAEEIQASSEATQSTLSLLKQPTSSDCGKRPLFTGKKRNAYNKCVVDAQAKKNVPVPIYIPAPVVTKQPEKLIGGVPQPVAITMIIVTTGLLIFLGLKLISPKKATTNLQMN